MGKKKVMSSTTPVFPFPAAEAADEPPHHHFSDYGFDPQLHFFQAMDEAKRPATTRRPPLDSTRFRLQKPISKNNKKHHPSHRRGRRRWWSAAASAALLFFKRSSNPTTAAAHSPSSYSNAAAWPLYLADADADAGGGEDASCRCWAPAFRSGHLAAAELGAASAVVPYVSLRDVSLAGVGGGGGAPAMPIYLVT